MGRWTLQDIPWDAFDPARIDPELVPVIKAASLVEYNASDYRIYLNRVFADDPRVCKAVDGWADEELQHGLALAKWAKLADPTFDFEASFKRFTDGYKLPLDATASVRGSRSGELISRCMIETGTNSFYSSLADATDEPVLKAICSNIAADEAAHYNLFHRHLARQLEAEKLGFWQRLRVALRRIAESEDDELAFAYYAANGAGTAYSRRRCTAAFGSRALGCYSPAIVRRGVGMIFTAIGLKPGGMMGTLASELAWWILCVQRLRCRAIVRRAGGAPEPAPVGGGGNNGT